MILKGFISSKSVIEDVYRDTQIDIVLPFEDMLYWIYEALSLMDQPLQFVRKVTGYKESPNLDITDYRAELPCDLYRIERIAVNGFPARYSGNSFHHLLSGDCCGAGTDASSSDIFTDNFGNQFSPQSSGMLGSTAIDEITFDVNNNFITLSVKTGKVCLAYLAFPTDESGYPMIPDEITYKVACKKYIIQKLRYVDWSKDPTNSGKRALFEYDEKEWLFYVGKATSKAKMPDVHQMENIKNQILRIIPNINEFDSFFNTLGSKQQKRIV